MSRPSWVVVTHSGNSEIQGACLPVIGSRGVGDPTLQTYRVAVPCKSGRRSYMYSVDAAHGCDLAAFWWWIGPDQWRLATTEEIAQAQLDQLAGGGL